MQFIERYFRGERAESLLFIIAGGVALLMALWFWFSDKGPFYKGMAWPLLLIGLIQIVTGSTVYLRSPKDIARVMDMLKREPQRIREEEIPRMEKVMKAFATYRRTEFTLVAGGLIFISVLDWSVFWRGVGWGLIIQSGAMLLLDLFAERRGRTYMKKLKKIS